MATLRPFNEIRSHGSLGTRTRNRGKPGFVTPRVIVLDLSDSLFLVWRGYLHHISFCLVPGHIDTLLQFEYTLCKERDVRWKPVVELAARRVYLFEAGIESYRSVGAVKAKVIALYAVVLSNANHWRQNVRRAEANRICGRTAPLLKPRHGSPSRRVLAPTLPRLASSCPADMLVSATSARFCASVGPDFEGETHARASRKFSKRAAAPGEWK